MNFNGAGITVKTPLEIAVSAYEQSQMGRFVARRFFPVVPVKKRTGDFWKLNPSDWLRNQVQKRKSGTIALRGGWRFQEGPLYRIIEYTAKIGVPRQDRREQMENGLPDPVVTNRRWVMEQLMLNQELIFASRFATAGFWDTEWDGEASGIGAGEFLQWNDAASTPIDDVGEFLDAIHAKTGLTPNTALFPRSVVRALRTNPQIIDALVRVSDTRNQVMPGEALLREVFDIPNIVIVDSVVNTAGPEATTPTLSQIYGKNVLFAYVGGDDLGTAPSAGHIITWKDTEEGTSDNGIVLDEWYDRDTKSFICEGSMFFDMMSTSNKLGGLMKEAIA